MIDQFGDHLLGCSHEPFRIQRHDALVLVVHHILLQDHPGVLREQGTSTSDRSRPGDIYHPNFVPGHPAYFDLSVWYATQSVFIFSTASQDGVATAAGEEAKVTSNQYLDTVNKSGGDFIPCVCESFGVWMPSALSTLFLIVGRLTI